MKNTSNTHHIVTFIVLLSLSFTPSMAENSEDFEALPSAEKIADNEPKLELRTRTVYESSFLPGVRLCEQEEVDYRGEFRKINCQDDELIHAVSTRKADPYNTRPNRIVDDRIEPNGNIFRIDFRRKTNVVENTSDN